MIRGVHYRDKQQGRVGLIFARHNPTLNLFQSDLTRPDLLFKKKTLPEPDRRANPDPTLIWSHFNIFHVFLELFAWITKQNPALN